MTEARPPLAAVALLSTASLAFEVLLLRVLAIVQWHHFAFLAISAALLGLGAAGSLVAIARERITAAWPASFALPAAGFGLAVPACVAVAQRVPFNALEIAWDPGQIAGLAAIYGLLLVPFLCVGLALCAAYSRFGDAIPKLYAADILGAGAGSLLALGLAATLPPADALRAVSACGLLAAWMATPPRRPALRWTAAALVALPLLLPSAWLALVPSAYKDQSQALRAKGARVVAETHGPLGVVTAVENPLAPPRHAPGLSLLSASAIPAQIALFVDGQMAGAVNRFDGDLAALAFLRDTTSALPYALLDQPRVLVLGAGGGADILQALVHGARTVDAVEQDARLVQLVDGTLGEFSGRPYRQPGVQLHVAEARGHVAATPARHDLVQVALLDGFTASAAGLGALAESPLYTVEALDAYLDRLEPGGLLAFTRWAALPPRDVLRLFATAVAALERRGITDPGAHLALIRGPTTVTLVAGIDPLGAERSARVRGFANARAFDVVHLPGLPAAEANVYNQLARDDYRIAVDGLLGPGRSGFIERYKFDIAPVTDDRPYYFHFHRWRTLPELAALHRAGALPPVDWGFPVLLAALAQAVAAGACLILLPLALGRLGTAAGTSPGRLRVAAFFLALGLAFMAIEIVVLQRLTLFLAHPVYAAAVALAAFLVFAGLGARFSTRLRDGTRWHFVAIVGLASAYALGMPALLEPLMGAALPWKMLAAAALVAPLAFCMGMPFPRGLRALAARAAPLVPWAWGINGFASVVATVLALLLAIHAGQTAVMLAGAALYVAAAALTPDRN